MPQQVAAGPALARVQAQPSYFFNGVRYASLEQLQAALRQAGVVPQEASEDPKPVGKHWRAAATGAKQYLARINSLLQDVPKFRALVQQLFVAYAGADMRLQQDEATWLMISLGAQIGVSNPTQVFGEVRQLFFRFDFSGNGELELAECEHLVKFMLRKARDKLTPKTGIKLCHLPQKNLHSAYNIVRQLGQGGQGAVYLVNERGADGVAGGQQRVVKFYSKADTNAPLDDIKEEFMLLKQLDHPTIARVLDIFEDNANVYVVSEPYFGGDLTTLVTKAAEHGVTPTVDWVGGVFKQVLEGLTYLHSQMIMHCDMKEPNIMVAHDSDWSAPQVVIIDFGMAKDFGGAREGGTPGYMPPEVWESKLWTPKGDIFSLAVTFWAIFNGRRGGPFCVPDAPPYARVRMLTCQQPMDCSSFPPGLRELTGRMAIKDFRQRPTAKAVLADPFFQHLSHRGQPLEASTLDALRRASEKRSIQNLVAMDLMASENLGQLRHLNDLFQRLDLDNDGTVEIDEARKVFAELSMDQAQADRLISALVGDKGAIHYSEFMAKLFLAQRGVQEEQLAASFASIDADGSGTLDLKEIEALLARPNVAAIMEGRTAADIIREMDRDGDGVVDFSEFRRAMLGEGLPAAGGHAQLPWAVGDRGRYFSRSHSMWLACQIAAVDESSGSVAIDLKPGYWITPQEQQSLLLRGCRAWAAGDLCRIYSQVQRVFLNCRVLEVNAAGQVMIDAKPGCWLPAWAVSEPPVQRGCAPAPAPAALAQPPSGALDGAATARTGERRQTMLPPDGGGPPRGTAKRLTVAGTAQASVDEAQRGALGTQFLAEGKAWCLGDRGKYFSKRQNAWFDFVITSVDPARGAVQINVKPDYWILPEEQREVLRHT